MERPPCVVCNGYNDGNHHCPPATIAAIERGRKAHEESREYKPYYGTRLGVGFYYLNGSNDYVE